MPAKSAAAKKPVAKIVAKKPVAKTLSKPVPKTLKSVAKKPAVKAVANKNTKVTAKPVAKKPVAKTVTKVVAKVMPKAVAKKPVAKPAPAAKKPLAKTPVKASVKAMTKPAVKAPVAKAAPKAATKAPAAKNAKNNLSVEEAVARVMGVVGKKETAKTAKLTAKPADKKAANDAVATPVAAATAAKTAKAVAAPSVAKTAKNDNVFDYKAGDMVVYPAHGVGQVDGVETLTIGGIEVTLYTITFAKDRMRLKLPLQKIKTSGLRPLSTKEQMQSALQTMRGRARIKRVMWSRRAQEYEAKINSGSPVQVAEVLRDLRRNATGAENSYSERQIFQSALERLASELAAIEKIGEADAAIKLQNVLTEAA